MTQMQRKLRGTGTPHAGVEHRGMVIEPVKPRQKPSAGYIKTLVELGAPKETVEIAQGKRKFRKHHAF